MEQQTNPPLDFFTYWSNLAKTDPERFEKERKEATEAVISSAPEHLKRRLVGLQWRIDMERSRASNPLSAAVRLHKMMADFAWSDKGFPHIASLCRQIVVITDQMKEEFANLKKE